MQPSSPCDYMCTCSKNAICVRSPALLGKAAHNAGEALLVMRGWHCLIDRSMQQQMPFAVGSCHWRCATLNEHLLDPPCNLAQLPFGHTQCLQPSECMIEPLLPHPSPLHTSLHTSVHKASKAAESTAVILAPGMHQPKKELNKADAAPAPVRMRGCCLISGMDNPKE